MKNFFIIISDYLKALVAIIVVVLFPISLGLVAYPKNLGGAIFLGFFLLSVIICDPIRKGKLKLDLLEAFSIFSLIVYTQVMRITFLAHESNDHLLIIKLAQLKFTTGEELTSALCNFIMVSYLMILISGIACRHVSEAEKGFSQEVLNTKFIEIDNRLSEGQLTEEQAVTERKKLRSDSDYYSERAGTIKIIFKCMVAFIVMTGVNFFTGIGSDMYNQKILFSEAFDKNIPLAIGAAYPFIVLFVLFAVTCFWSRNE